MSDELQHHPLYTATPVQLYSLLTSARAELTSAYGLIESRWQLSGERFTLHVTVPVNTTATVTLPATSPEDVRE